VARPATASPNLKAGVASGSGELPSDSDCSASGTSSVFMRFSVPSGTGSITISFRGFFESCLPDVLGKLYISEPEGDHIYYMKTEIVLIYLRQKYRSRLKSRSKAL
jgi:hypothetical protein